MASVSEADARDAELAALSGEKLVDLLRITHRRTDFDAAARVLKARDRRFADLKAALSDIDALRKKHHAILGGARRRPRDEAEAEAEAEEITPLPGIASRDPAHRDDRRVEDLDDVPLVQRLKRPRQSETSDLESGKRDGQRRSDSAGTLGNYGQKSSPAKSVHHSFGPKERIGKLVPKDSKRGISNLKRKDPKQGRGAVSPPKWGGGMTRTAPLLSPGRSVLPKGSSESDRGRARIGKKQSSSDGILGPPPKWNGKIISTSMVESSSSSANKDTGTAMSLYRQSMDAKGGNPVQETRMVASPSLKIGTISASELRAYCLKQQQTPLASCMEIKRQNFRDSAKGGNGLSMEPVDVSSKKKLVGGD